MIADLKFSVHTQGLEEIAYRLRDNVTKAEHDVAVEIQKDTELYVPARTKSLANRTKVRGNAIIYPGPYARVNYYGKLMVDPATGSTYAPEGGSKVVTEKDIDFKTKVHKNAQSHWFEASKAQNLDKWVETAEKAVTKFGDK